MPILPTLRRAVALFCFCALALAPAWGMAVAADPAAAVNSFDAALLDAMKNASALGPKGRFERLRPVMAEQFDLAGMTREIAGLQWSRLSEEQRERLVSAFSRFEVALFADWFDSYAGQTFEVKDIVVRNDDVATVGVALSGPARPLRLEYVLKAETPGAWRIVDIRYEGWMSTVERRRGEFAEILGHQGYDVLIARLESKGGELLDHPDDAASPHLRAPIRDLWNFPILSVY